MSRRFLRRERAFEVGGGVVSGRTDGEWGGGARPLDR